MTEAKTKTKTKAKAKSKRLPARTWAVIDALWEAGDATYNDLVAKFGVSRQGLRTHFKSKGIVQGSKKEEIAKVVSEDLTKAVSEEATILAARIKETKEEHYKMASGLAKLTWAEILKAKQDGIPVGTAINNLKALDTAMTVLKKAREERYAVLGLDKDAVDENEVPELVISELTADQIETLRKRSFSEIEEIEVDLDEDNGVNPGDDDVVEED